MDVVWYGVAAAPTIAGVIEALKVAGFPEKLAPIFAIILGVAGAIAIETFGNVTGAGLPAAVFQGVLAGLAAGKVYDFASATARRARR